MGRYSMHFDEEFFKTHKACLTASFFQNKISLETNEKFKSNIPLHARKRFFIPPSSEGKVKILPNCDLSPSSVCVRCSSCLARRFKAPVGQFQIAVGSFPPPVVVVVVRPLHHWKSCKISPCLFDDDDNDDDRGGQY